jgi:hypothetical protein
MYSMAVLPAFTLVLSGIAILFSFNVELWFLFVGSAIAWLLQIFNLALISVRAEVSPMYALTAPLGLGLLYAMLFDSSVRITSGKGVTWKGRKIYERDGISPPRARILDSNAGK